MNRYLAMLAAETAANEELTKADKSPLRDGKPVIEELSGVTLDPLPKLQKREAFKETSMQLDPSTRKLLGDAWRSGVIFELKDGKICWRGPLNPPAELLREIYRNVPAIRKALDVSGPVGRPN